MTDIFRFFHQILTFHSEFQISGNVFRTPKNKLRVIPVCKNSELIYGQLQITYTDILGERNTPLDAKDKIVYL